MIPYKACYSILGNGEIMTAIQISRGCPYNCIYCDEACSKFRRREARDVINEIKHCVSLGIKDFFFIDDMFTIDKQWVATFCDLLAKEELNIKYKISARVNTIDEEMLRKFKETGCYRIHYGIESGSQRLLDVLQKKITVEQQKEAMLLTKKVGVRTLCYFMIGSPTETKKEILGTIDYAIRLDPDYAHFSITTPYPGTQLYRDGLKKGVFSHDFWREFAENPSEDFQPQPVSNLSKDELKNLQIYANRKFYGRPKVFIRELANTNNARQFYRKLMAGLRILFSK